jgi:hypothetical protein
MAGTRQYHYFVINQLGQSADRRGPFESREAATEWAATRYGYPAWILSAEPANDKARTLRVLDKDGNPVTEG